MEKFDHQDCAMTAISPRAAKLIRCLMHEAPKHVNARLYKYYNVMEEGRFCQLWFHIPTHREVLSVVVWTKEEQRRLDQVYTDVLFDTLSEKAYAQTPYLRDPHGNLKNMVAWFLKHVNLICVEAHHVYYTAQDSERSVQHCIHSKRRRVHVRIARPADVRLPWWASWVDRWNAAKPWGRPRRFTDQEVQAKIHRRTEM